MELETSGTAGANSNSEVTIGEGAADNVAQTTTTAVEPQTIAEKINKIAAEKMPGAGAIDGTKPVYTPNFKFKAADKEHEFDAVFKDAIKNEAQEKKLRELYEKATGLDHVKSERERFRSSYKDLESQHSVLNRGLDQLSTMLEKKDYQGFFNSLKIPEQEVLQYALSRVKYRELPPEQRQQMDQQYESQQRLVHLEQANEQLITGYQQQLVQHRANELDGYIGRPEVNQVASAYDTRAGRPGAFREEVIRRGQYYASISGEDVPVERAVREVMSLVGHVAAPASAVVDTQNPQNVQATPAGAKPVIPNIKGRGTSPAKKVIRSIDDLRKLGQSMTE